MPIRSLFLLAFLIIITPSTTNASHADLSRPGDADHDGLLDTEESRYGTNPDNPDSDGDTYTDGNEVSHGYDPLKPGDARLAKRIDIDLSEQRLRYYYGEFGEQGSFLISSGKKGHRTPTGAFAVRRKLPVVRYSGYLDGKRYDYPRTKWNLEFFPRYFIHGAYWHNDFGRTRSKGCVNAPYAEMEKLYQFADVGTVVTVHE